MSQAYLVSEKHLQARIIEAAQALGWLVYHTHDSRRSAPGFPDLVMVRAETRGPHTQPGGYRPVGQRLVFAELKSDKGKLTPEQSEWLAQLALIPGVSVQVWRPSDLQTAIDFLR